MRRGRSLVANREQFPKAAYYTDFRKMFDKVDKEHRRRRGQHAGPHARAARAAGHEPRQARLLREAAGRTRSTRSRRHARSSRRRRSSSRRWARRSTPATTTAAWSRSCSPARSAPIKRVHVWNSSKPVGGKKLDAKPSAKFDLDLWLGPATGEFFEAAMNKPAGTSLAALPLAVVVGVRRRHPRRHRLPLHRPAVLGARPDGPDQRRATGKKTYERRQHHARRDAGGLQVPRDQGDPAVHLTWYHGVSGPGLDGKEKYEGFGRR